MLWGRDLNLAAQKGIGWNNHRNYHKQELLKPVECTAHTFETSSILGSNWMTHVSCLGEKTNTIFQNKNDNLENKCSGSSLHCRKGWIWRSGCSKGCIQGCWILMGRRSLVLSITGVKPTLLVGKRGLNALSCASYYQNTSNLMVTMNWLCVQVKMLKGRVRNSDLRKSIASWN